ncbi:tetratricopeptide repeat protein [Jejuia pallidilutea]|uniref:Tetratricopeptide repeat protein n=1 Tax=Jejuia pallidilutea TaxID=504487 RepID=A0A362XFS2_9FLAO|nr:tetratricopeptide repeat protein [Jejuia pallidilutea]PQV51142.1 tetratricopeptide repeat protein [Jejuia pallidilutea]
MTKPFYAPAIIFAFLFFAPLSFSQAKKLVRKGLREPNLEKQIELYNKALQIDDKNLDAYFYRGIAKANLEDHSAAILDFTKVIFFEPNGDTYYNRANSKFAIGDFKGAKEDYEEAIKLNRDLLIKATFNIGLSHFRLGEFYDALSSFSFIARINPKHIGANLQMGLTFMELGYQEKAMLYFNKSVNLDANQYTLYHRGLAYLEIKKYKKANEDLTAAANMDKSNAATYFYLGISQLFTRKYKAAALSFNTSLKFNALDYDALIGLAIANYHLEKHEKSKIQFNKAKHILYARNETLKDDKALFKDSFWEKNETDVFSTYFDKLNSL